MPFFEFMEKDIYYRQAGQGPLLMILPGNTASSACHGEDLAYFSNTFTAVSLDYLGTGQSDRLDTFGNDWYQQCADQAAALIQHLNLGQAVLLGTSGGAVVALHAAARHPNIFQGVIADSFTPVFTWEMLHENVIEERSIRSEGQVAFWRMAHGEDWERVIDADTDMLKRLTESGGRWLGDALARIVCPILFTASLEDRMLRQPASYTLQMLKEAHDGRAFLCQHGGHPLMWSNPGEFRRAVSGFLHSFLE